MPEISEVSESDKPIQKKILHAGRNPDQKEIKYVDGTKVKFHYVAKKLPEGTLLDDSRHWTQPMELVLGKKFKMEAWELCLQTMDVNEVSRFTIKRKLTYNYPTVAKTLRETFHPEHKAKKEKDAAAGHGHMCGMMAMQTQGGLGHDDLNELMKAPADIEFTLELVSVEQPEDYNKESWQMDVAEKTKKIPELKEEGNKLFKEQKLEEAEEKYKVALGMLEQLMLREKPNDDEWLELQEVKIPILLNFAQCKLSKKEYYEVIEHCTEVLVAKPDHVKAIYRRAKAHVGAWNPSAAKADFQRVIVLDPSLEKACRKEIRAIEELEKKKNQEDKEKLRNLF